MNTHQITDLKLLYEAVYNDELREKAEEYNNQILDEEVVEVATEYFYTYGLNEDGIDILIEKVGLDNFVEFVYDFSEDLVLTEAKKSKAKKQPSLLASQRAKLAAQKAAKERTESEREEPESKGLDTEAKEEQSKSKKPVRDAIARNIFRAVDAYKAGMKRHREATQTAGNLARETGKTLGKIASVTHEAGRRAGEHVKKHGLKSLANEEFDNFDIILEYLVAEGYADTNQNALVIMANMSEEWKEEIVEGRVASEKMSSDERRRARNDEYREENPTLPSGNPMGPNAQLMRQMAHAKKRGVKKRQ